jgi:predicted Zn-dependent protease
LFLWRGLGRPDHYPEFNPDHRLSIAQLTAMRTKTASCVAAFFFVSACAQVNTTNPGLVGVDRAQYLSIPAEEFNRSMANSYAKTMGEARHRHDLNQDGAMVGRVRAIAQRMIPHTAIFRSDAPGWQWEVNVIQSQELNAFCIGQGKIGFYSSIIEKLRLTDDEIAAIMGHEIAHVLREHGRERASQQSRSQWVAGLIGAVVGDGHGEVSHLSALFYLLPNSREQETEADRMGVELAASAGYDSRAAITVWRKFQWLAVSQPPQFLSTHPSHASRLKDLQTYSEKVAALYKLVPNKD